MTGTDEHYDGNLDYWEQAAAAHGTTATDRYYRLDTVVAGGSLMTELEERALALATGAPEGSPLAALAGRDVMHLQSHLGADAVVMARAGARVTAVDFSPTALQRCRELAARTGVEVETVVADARDLPASLHDRFDLVYVTIGAICWIDDLPRWMRQVAAVLRSGGRLVMVEMHPLFQVFDAREPELVADLAYGGGESYTSTDTGTYSDPAADFASTTTCYAHSLGDAVMAAIDTGLRVDVLAEHTEVRFDPRSDGVLRLEDDGFWRFRLGRGRHEGAPGVPLPILFTLLATKV